MMAAQFPPHPGGMQPGLPHGHPGMPPGAQPMGHAMQMTPGVSGPGGNPHMAQTAAMMGMQPGGMPGGMAGQTPGGMGMPGHAMGGPGPGPNHVAMGHLTPHQSMMLQQQQQMQQQNQQQNTLQLQQRQALARQQQHIMMQQQQQQHLNSMGMMPGQAGHMNMSPQQLAQLQQNNPALHGPGGLQPHQITQLQHLHHQRQQQQLAMQQQAAQQQQAQQHQAQQQQQQQQQQAQQHAQQQPPQQQQAQQGQAQQTPQMPPQTQLPGQTPTQPPNMAHHIAMQHAPSQTSNHSQAGLPQQGQQGPAGQIRAQSQAPTNPSEAQPAQAQQQGPQGGPSNPQQNQQANPQQPTMDPQQQQQLQHQQALQRQQQAMGNMMQQQARGNILRQQQAMQNNRTQGSYILKTVLFTDQLSSFHADKRTNDIDYWQSFVSKFFAPDGRLVQHVWYPTGGGRTKEFTVPAASLPRYYWTHYNSGVQNLQMKVESAKESQLPNACWVVGFEKAQFTFWYGNGTQVIWTGKLSATFAPGSDKFEFLEFEIHKHDEYLPRSDVEKVLTASSPVMNRSPKLSKNTQKQKAMQKLQSGLSISNFATAPINEYGTTDAVMKYLEIGETFFYMQNLIEFSQRHQARPADALNGILSSLEEANANQQNGNNGGGPQQPGIPGQGPVNMQRQGTNQFPAGSRTPMQAQMQLPGNQQGNFSPAVPNMGLPMNHLNGPMMNGSPHIAQQGLPGQGLAPHPAFNLGQSHTPSPHLTNMAAPPMVPQHSSQGQNAANTNTSPNATTKRRRSQIKTDADDGGDTNGNQKVKQSPRVGGNKKVKT